jgi:hypothetical protein
MNLSYDFTPPVASSTPNRKGSMSPGGLVIAILEQNVAVSCQVCIALHCILHCIALQDGTIEVPGELLAVVLPSLAPVLPLREVPVSLLMPGHKVEDIMDQVGSGQYILICPQIQVLLCAGCLPPDRPPVLQSQVSKSGDC